MKYILCLLIALATFTASPSRALSPEIQADLLLIRAIEAIDDQNYQLAMSHFEELANLDVPKPEAFLFHYGKTALKAGRATDAIRLLEAYLNTAGQSGEFYQSALRLYEEARVRPSTEFDLCDKLMAMEMQFAPGIPDNPDTPQGLKLIHWEEMEYEKAIPPCRFAANAFPNEPRMSYNLGRALAFTKNYEEGYRWYEKAAYQGYPAAQYSFSYAFLSDEYGYAKDLDARVNWLRKAAKQGHLMAAYDLAYAYRTGSGVSLNVEAAVHWYRFVKSHSPIHYQMKVIENFVDPESPVKDHAQAAIWLDELLENENYTRRTDFGFLVWRYYQAGGDGLKNVANHAVFKLCHTVSESYPGKQRHHAQRDMQTQMTRDVQKRLRNLGLYSGPIDGKLGDSTDNAIRAYGNC